MPGTRTLGPRLNAEFDEWYARSLESGGIVSTVEKAVYWPEFTAARMIKREEELREEMAEEKDRSDRKEERESKEECRREKGERTKALKEFGRSI